MSLRHCVAFHGAQDRIAPHITPRPLTGVGSDSHPLLRPLRRHAPSRTLMSCWSWSWPLT